LVSDASGLQADALVASIVVIDGNQEPNKGDLLWTI